MKKLLIVAFLLIIPLLSHANLSFYAHSHWVTAGTVLKIAWTPVPEAAGYEFQIRRMEKNTILYQTSLTGTQISVTFRTPGHDVIYVRWFKVVNGVKEFSEWKNSLERDSSLVLVGENWTSRAWWIIVPTSY